MEGGAELALGRGSRCLLVTRQEPIAAPLAYWFDGTSAWMAPPASSPFVAALERDPGCTLWVDGILAEGVARVFSLRDPLGLAIHSPTLAAAMAALATTNASTIAGYVQGAARQPSRLRPGNRVGLRVSIADAERAGPPPMPPGIAPALPTVVPADVRRALAGRRDVLLATAEGVTRAMWAAGFTLTVPNGFPLEPGTEAVAALDADGLGISLAGTVTPGPALRPQHASWWHGFAVAEAGVPEPAATPGGITLPD